MGKSISSGLYSSMEEKMSDTVAINKHCSLSSIDLSLLVLAIGNVCFRNWSVFAVIFSKL